MKRSFSYTNYTKRIAIISSLLLLLIPTFSAPRLTGAAPSSALTMRAEALWNGLYREGGWVVINVDIANPGPKFDAQITISAPLGYDQTHTDFHRTVTISANNSSRFQLYVCLIQQVSNLSVVLTNEDGQVLNQTGVQVTVIDYYSYLVGAVGNTAPAATPGQAVTPTLFGSKKRVQTLFLTPEQLPDRPEGLSAFNALILRDVGVNQLNHDQYNALLNWTLAGGRLIIAPTKPDSWAELDKLFEAVIPARLVENEKTIQLDAQTTIFDPLNAKQEAILNPVGSNNLKLLGLEARPSSQLISNLKQSSGQLQPLVIAAKTGQGWTVATAADPFLPTMAASNAYWNGLLDSLAPISNYDPSNDNILQDSSLARAFLNETVSHTESITLNLLFITGLALYLLLIIPLNYLIWRKATRPELALLTLPLSALLVSVGLIAASSNQQQVSLHRLNIIQFHNPLGEANAWVGSLMTMRSSGDSGCVLSFKHEQPLLRPSIVNAAASEGAQAADDKGFVRSPQQINQQPNTVNCDSTGGVPLNLVTLEDWQTLQPPVANKLQLTAQTLTAKLTNQANYTLEDTVLVLGENYQMLGEWKPQQQLEVNFKLANLPDNFATASTSVIKFLRNNPPTAIPDNLYNAMLSTVTHIGRFGSANQTNTAYIVGWAKNLMSDNVEVNQNISSNKDLSFIIQPIEFQLIAQPESPSSQPVFQLPPQLFMPRLIQNDAQNTPEGEALNSGGIQIREYQLPPQTPLNLQVHNLTISLASFYLSNLRPQILSSVPEIALFNWQTQSWRVLVNEDTQTDTIAAYILNDELEPQTHAFRLRLKSLQRVHLIQKFNISLDIK